MAFSYHAPQHPFDLPIVEPHLSTTAAADASSSSCFIHAIAADDAAAAFPYSPSDAHLLANRSKRKRKSGDEESLVSGEDYKDGGDASARQKRAKKKANADDETKKDSSCKASSDPTGGGYIHVRARRGQATDSHSLAERVRREKISERMKMLQGLVPGCEKVTGKALMLDEIINYVQSLQNQVEFLSMRIASLSPTLYDFNVDLEDRINQHHHHQKMIRSNMPQKILPSLEQANKAFEHGEANYQVMESSPVQVLQGPTAISQVDGQRVGFLDQLGFINMCSFQ